MKLMEKGQGWLFWAVGAISLMSLFFAWGSAHADTLIYEQPDSSQHPYTPPYLTSTLINYAYHLTAAADKVSSVTLYLDGSAPAMQVRISCYLYDGSTVCPSWAALGIDDNNPITSDAAQGPLTGTKTAYTWTFSSTPSVGVGEIILVELVPTSGGNYQPWGNGGGFLAMQMYGGSSTPPPPAYTSPTLTYISPYNGTTASSTSVELGAGYFVPDATSSRDTITQIELTLLDLTNGYQFVENATSTLHYGDVSTFATTTTLISGHTYILQSQLLGPDGVFVLGSDANTIGADNTGRAIFNVISNGLPTQIGVGSTTEIYTGLATSTCTLLNITGCFQNALVWAFYPSSSMLEAITNDGQLIAKYHPVGDVTQTISALKNVGATTTAAFTLVEDAPIMTNILTPLVNGIALVCWLPFAVWFLKRIRHVEI
jgi:hypothetical protein